MLRQNAGIEDPVRSAPLSPLRPQASPLQQLSGRLCAGAWDISQINLNGKRWIDETGHLFGMTPHIAEQPKEISWSIQSLDNLTEIANRFINNPAMASKKNLYETWLADLEEECTLKSLPERRIRWRSWRRSAAFLWTPFWRPSAATTSSAPRAWTRTSARMPSS